MLRDAVKHIYGHAGYATGLFSVVFEIGLTISAGGRRREEGGRINGPKSFCVPGGGQCLLCP